jgi:AraC family transcriptional regulator, transcriptional activator of pobA
MKSTPNYPLSHRVARPFEIQVINPAENGIIHESVAHRHDCFEIVWIVTGGGHLLIDLARTELTCNTIYSIAPGQVHLLQPDTSARGFVITFTNEFFAVEQENFDILRQCGLIHAYNQRPSVKVSSLLEEQLHYVVEQMMLEYKNYFISRSKILRGLLKIFLIYLTRQLDQPSVDVAYSRNADLVKKFMMLLERDYTSRRMVSDYADELSVSPNYLNEIVKRQSGYPASYHIQQRIALEAKRQAFYAVRSMKEVAADLGFDDIAYFSKFFKKVVGVNFTDFKKNAGNAMHA